MLKTLLLQFWWLILLVAGVGLIKIFKPFLKGKVGELAVSTHVKLYLDERYILLNDVTLPDEFAGTTQIDHILLSPFGVFVIETKNYKGWIFGGERQKVWTQKDLGTNPRRSKLLWQKNKRNQRRNTQERMQRGRVTIMS